MFSNEKTDYRQPNDNIQLILGKGNYKVSKNKLLKPSF